MGGGKWERREERGEEEERSSIQESELGRDLLMTGSERREGRMLKGKKGKKGKESDSNSCLCQSF